MTKEVLSILRNIPSLRNVPQSSLVAFTSIAAVFGLLFLFISLFLIFSSQRSEEKEHKSPETHKMIMELQKTLIQEMKGTSKQNTLMIILTIIFILVTITGGGIFLSLYQKVKQGATIVIPKIILTPKTTIK